MNQNQNTPELRFDGFTELWKQHKLGDLGSVLTGMTPPTADENNYDGLYAFVCPGDMNNGRFIDSTQITLSKKGFDLGRIIPAGASLFVCIGSTIGKVGQVSDAVVTNQQINALVPTSETDPDYAFTLLEHAAPSIKAQAATQAVPIINKSAFSKTIVRVPHVKEQRIIGAFFRSLDSLIILQQHKHERLQHLKQALLRKMFPKPGEQVPELRFDGFTEPWKEYRLGDLGEVAMCKRIYKDQTSDSGDVPFFKIGTFGGKPDAYISNELFEEYRSKFPFPDAGDVLISAAGTIGRTVVYNGERAYYQDSNIVWLKHGDEINNLFFLQFLKVKDWKNLEGSTLKRLYNKDILETPIALPETAEQNAVGSFFRDIDSLIALHQRKYERLRRLKQALLRKMFV